MHNAVAAADVAKLRFESLWCTLQEGKAYCIRVRLDMKADNACLRDPVMWRCSDHPHWRTGTAFKCYPTYDFACPFVDAYEGVTHALRTSEYRDREEQFQRILALMREQAPELPPVTIWDYSRLNFVHTGVAPQSTHPGDDECSADGSVSMEHDYVLSLSTRSDLMIWPSAPGLQCSATKEGRPVGHNIVECCIAALSRASCLQHATQDPAWLWQCFPFGLGVRCTQNTFADSALPKHDIADILPHLAFARSPHIHAVLSKRKLQKLVDTGVVSGWNDPRFPTVQGILRRGLTLQALRDFIISQARRCVHSVLVCRVVALDACACMSAV